MNRHHVTSFAAAALSLALAAGCEKRPEQQTQVNRTTETTATGETTTTSATTSLSSQDKDFLTKAAQGSMAEVRIGQDAQKRGVIPEVKALAGKMVTDHGKASADLSALAQKKNVTLPTDTTDDAKDFQAKLAKQSGPAFDKEYVEHMVDDHQKDLKAFQKEVDDGADPDVKAFAAQMVPILTQHLQEAKDAQMAERAKEGKAKR